MLFIAKEGIPVRVARRAVIFMQEAVPEPLLGSASALGRLYSGDDAPVTGSSL
jgi:hypothetical protein